MDDLKEKTIDLVDDVEDLADTFYRLTVLNVTQKATNVASGAVVMVVLCALGFFVLLFAGFAFAWWLGTIVNSQTGGFLLAAGSFLILIVIVSLLAKKTIFPFIRNRIIRNVYD